ncbi:cytochrome d ubiquinol oxidase subunit II [Streptomyces sp. NPDC046759]|uniref:cytochrome d ubiquinol oxidase subunit II n=1 Tax=Streptomyces sp. NPDC046759 TaxID=3155019 RepID=UPI0033C0E7DB
MSTTMWLPLALAAVGIVLRGAGFALRRPVRRLAGRRLYGAVFAVASLLTPFALGAAAGEVASGRVTATTTASTDAWANPTSLLFGLLAIAATATLGAVFLAADARRFAVPDLDRYFRRRALGALAAVALLAVVTLFVTHWDAPHAWHGPTHGAGLVFVVVAALATLATAWLLTRPSGAWSRVSAAGVVASAIIARGMAQRPCLVPTSLTIAEGAGAHPTLRRRSSSSSPSCSSSPRSPRSTGCTPMASWTASPTPTCGAAAPVTRADLVARGLPRACSAGVIACRAPRSG